MASSARSRPRLPRGSIADVAQRGMRACLTQLYQPVNIREARRLPLFEAHEPASRGPGDSPAASEIDRDVCRLERIHAASSWPGARYSPIGEVTFDARSVSTSSTTTASAITRELATPPSCSPSARFSAFRYSMTLLLLAAHPSDQDQQQELDRELHDLNASSVSASKIGPRRCRRRTINYSISERFCVGGVLAQYGKSTLFRALAGIWPRRSTRCSRRHSHSRDDLGEHRPPRRDRPVPSASDLLHRGWRIRFVEA